LEEETIISRGNGSDKPICQTPSQWKRDTTGEEMSGEVNTMTDWRASFFESK